MNADRIAEPGWGSVVEAQTEGYPQWRHYVRAFQNGWVAEGSGSTYDWSDLIDPLVVCEFRA